MSDRRLDVEAERDGQPHAAERVRLEHVPGLRPRLDGVRRCWSTVLRDLQPRRELARDRPASPSTNRLPTTGLPLLDVPAGRDRRRHRLAATREELAVERRTVEVREVRLDAEVPAVVDRAISADTTAGRREPVIGRRWSDVIHDAPSVDLVGRVVQRRRPELEPDRRNIATSQHAARHGKIVGR